MHIREETGSKQTTDQKWALASIYTQLGFVLKENFIYSTIEKKKKRKII